jgi:hypothetical protein
MEEYTMKSIKAQVEEVERLEEACNAWDTLEAAGRITLGDPSEHISIDHAVEEDREELRRHKKRLIKSIAHYAEEETTLSKVRATVARCVGRVDCTYEKYKDHPEERGSSIEKLCFKLLEELHEHLGLGEEEG